MKKSVFLCCILLVVSSQLLAVNGNMGNGDGSQQSPYLIEDLADFDEFLSGQAYWQSGVYTSLGVNIDLSGRVYNAPLVFIDYENGYKGIFDGNDHVISNVNIDNAVGASVFFMNEGVIKNLVIENVIISPEVSSGNMLYCAGLCSKNMGTIYKCHTSGLISAPEFMSQHIGGLCAANYGDILFSHSDCDIVVGDPYWVGGFAGLNNGVIRGCYSSGNVIAQYGSPGSDGLAGFCGSVGGTISNSYSIGQVMTNVSEVKAAGFCFLAYGKVYNCYTTESNRDFWLNRSSFEMGGTVRNCFVDSGSGGESSDGANGVYKRPTEQMKDIQTFISKGWDFVGENANGTHEFWQMSAEGGYPLVSYLNGYVPPVLNGAGSTDSPYMINNVNDLGVVAFNYDISRCYRLGADIDMSGISWSSSVLPIFNGVLDGNGHVVKSLVINTIESNGGLIGRLGSLGITGAVISNIGVCDVDITAVDYIGGVCGYSQSGSISRVFISNGVLKYDNMYGGVVGGVVGLNYGVVSDCYSSCEYQDGPWSGGLCGWNSAQITNSYTASKTNGTMGGGFCGYNNGDFVGCFWDTEVSDIGKGVNYGGDSGITGLTTSQMKKSSNFIDAGWDFANTWTIGENQTYPTLKKNIGADINNDGKVDLLDLKYIAIDWLK